MAVMAKLIPMPARQIVQKYLLSKVPAVLVGVFVPTTMTPYAAVMARTIPILARPDVQKFLLIEENAGKPTVVFVRPNTLQFVDLMAELTPILVSLSVQRSLTPAENVDLEGVFVLLSINPCVGLTAPPILMPVGPNAPVSPLNRELVDENNFNASFRTRL